MIQSKINTETVSFSEFPKLMESKITDLIVLFSQPEIGVIVFKPETNSIFGLGCYEKDWKMINFTDYNGEITLKNI
jgi:hypothetical protein